MKAINTYELKAYINSAKPNSLIELECPHCGGSFERVKNVLQSKFGPHNNFQRIYCSSSCSFQAKIVKQKVICLQCAKEFLKLPNQIKKFPNHFCSHSCAATYNNTHKTTGTRRSKLEVWLEEQLKTSYPNLDIHFSRKDTINSELDIYIP